MACVHKYGSKIVDGVEVPEYYYDFALRIVPPPAPKRVSIARCHEFIKYMRDNLGLRIGLVTFDQFQSMASRQYLEEIGIPVKYQSVDKTDEQYVYFVDCMYNGNVHFNNDFANMIHKELFDLIWFRSKRKVDHPGSTKTNGTKDICDGVVGALYNAKTTQDIIVRPEDILNLAKYNSDNVYDNPFSSPADDDELISGIKKVSLDSLEDPYMLRGDM